MQSSAAYLITTLQKEQNDPLLRLINLPRPPLVFNPLGPRSATQSARAAECPEKPAGPAGRVVVGLPKPDAHKQLLLQQLEYLRLTAAIVKEMDVFDRAILKKNARCEPRDALAGHSVSLDAALALRG